MASVNPYSIKIIGDLDTTRMAKQLRQFEKSARMTAGGKTGKGGFYADIGKDAQKAGKGIKGFNGQIQRTTKQLKNVKGTVGGKTFRAVSVETQQASKHMRSLGSETLNVAKKVMQFGAVTAVIRGATSGIADMVQNVFELDAALTEFRKVSDLSEKGLARYTDQAYRTGREVAKTGSEMIQAATEFKKSGYNEQDAMQLGKIASMYQNVADQELTAGEAANFIVSQMKAYNIEAGNAEHVIDAVNEVSNKFAVSSADIATNIGKASAAMSTGNVTYEQSIGLLTAMTEITRNGAKGARGLISIQSRYNQIVDESSSTGKKLTAWYKEHGIAIKDQNGQLRSFYDVGKDVADIWDTLSDNEKRYYLNTQAGANQSQNLAALMKNYGTAVEATATATDSAGSASRENARYLDSLEGHLQELKSAWEELSYKIVNSDMLKKGMDILTSVIKGLSSDTGQLVLKFVAMFTALNLGAKALSGISSVFKGLKLIRIITGFGRVTKGVEGVTKASKGLRYASLIMKSQFGDLAKLLFNPAGLIVGLGLASVALAKYVDIGKDVEANKANKSLKETKDKLEDLNEKLKENRKEWKHLKEKQANGEELTESEKRRLRVLEQETTEYKRQYDLLKSMESKQATKKWTSSAGSQLKGEAGRQYKSLRSSGQSEESAMASLGLGKNANRLDVSLVNYKIAAEEATRAQNEYTQAVKDTDKAAEKYGKNSKEYEAAVERETAAWDKKEKTEKDSSKYLKELTKQRDKLYEDYGSKEIFDKEAPKTLKKSRDQLDAMIKAAGDIQDLKEGAGDVTKAFKNLNKASKASGKNFLKLSKDGKKIERINVRKLQQSMADAGVSAEDTLQYLKDFAKANPEAEIKLHGDKVAIKDLEVIDGQIQKVDEEKAEPEIDANTKDADDKIKKTGKQIEKLSGKKGDVKLGVTTSKGGAISKFKNAFQSIKSKDVKLKTHVTGKKTLDNTKNTWKSFKDKSVTLTIKKKTKNVDEKHGVRHFAGGIANAQVNEQGFEIIQDATTGRMRVANGGKRGLTYIGDGDTVYTHGQSVRMLQRAGQTEGGSVFGHGDRDFDLYGLSKPIGYKKGKLSKKQYNKKYNQIVKDFDKALEKLEYERDYYHWSNAEYAQKYTELYDEYNAKLISLNEQKVKSGVKRKSDLGTERVRAYNLVQSDTESEEFQRNIESTLKDIIGDATGLEEMLKAIQEADEAQRITADETAEFIKEAYKVNAEYNLKQFKNNKETYANMRKLIEDFYQQGKISGEDYYDYLEELAEEQLDKEKERLSERLDKTENTYDLARAYVQRQIDLLETENEEQEKQNELVELQNNLAKARNQRIRIYKEGEGFVYEQDTEAIREATQALQDYKSESTSAETATNPVLAQWQAVLDLFDDLEADYELKALENKVGSTVGALFGDMGTDTGAWSDWIKGNLSTSYGLQDVLDQMDTLVDTNDILNYLDQNGQVTDAIIDAAIANNVLPVTYAAAVTQAAQGIGAITNTGANIASQSAIAGLTSGAVVMSGGTQYGNVYNFDNLVLPNVTNASEFVDSLDNLPNTALQVSTQRG